METLQFRKNSNILQKRLREKFKKRNIAKMYVSVTLSFFNVL